MDDDQQFCLRWNNHQSTLISVFDTLLENGTLVDCTLAAEGKFLKAHKVVLCACSPYFASLLSQQYDKHPIFILKDVKFQELRAMMDYMYRGEVNISQDQLAALLKAAESLQIKGLSDNRSGSSAKGVDNAQQQKQQVPVSGGAAGSAAKTGLTIEQNNKRPNAELPGDREGSTSPMSRKRKRVRRRSVDTNNAAVDNHDQMSNSSSQSATQQAQPITSTPLTLSQITTATSAANVLNVTKKTDNNSNDDDDDDEEEQTIVRHKTRNTDGSNKDKIESELLIEPKSEYEDGNDDAVEDLTMADEELMEDLEQAGPSHGGEGSSQGYAQWQVDRSQDEVYLSTQESAGQHRDAQGKTIKKKSKVMTPATVATASGAIASAAAAAVAAAAAAAATAASTPKTPNTSTAIATITPTAISTPISVAARKDDSDLTAKLNNIVVASNALPHVSAISSVASSSSVTHALTSTILTSSNMTVATNNNQSYQLLFATVPKTSHPRIKYSGLKKSDDISPLIVEAVLPASASNLSANTANILDISGITPLMTAPLQQLSTITIPSQKNSQIINITNNDLSPAIKYADIDDIELPDGTKIGYPTESEIKRMQQHSTESLNDTASYTSNLAEKYSILAATALKNFDLSLNESATLNQSNGTIITNNGSMSEVRSIMVSGSNNDSNEGDGSEELFACRHCGKKYRWKSTLRRHENDECGDKEPSHQCPYCPYKAKQRGNLGVHVRKHHANMPQLESRRKRKT